VPVVWSTKLATLRRRTVETRQAEVCRRTTPFRQILPRTVGKMQAAVVPRRSGAEAPGPASGRADMSEEFDRCLCWTAPQATRLVLLGSFELSCVDGPVVLPLGAQRLMAFLAIQELPLLRTYVAEALWPESSRNRANANLRSIIWRIRQTGHNLVQADGCRLRLPGSTAIDLQEYMSMAYRLLSEDWEECDPKELDADLVTGLSTELLRDWYDEWLMIERDRWDQLRLHALEALAERLLAAGEFSNAVQAALAAIGTEPLRESAHRMLIRVHAAEGNWSQCITQYRRYRMLLQRELSSPPTAQMEELMNTLAPR
jgi:DNA-binding SARP family transcriptional activator